MNFVSFYFFRVATGKLISTYVIRIIFVLDTGNSKKKILKQEVHLFVLAQIWDTCGMFFCHN